MTQPGTGTDEGAEQVALPKSFFESERDKFYSDWKAAFPREFVQNSVDAKASRIAITVAEAAGKGSFGRAPTLGGVTRVTFEDDGRGMTREVLDKVFFALGESTKRADDGAVGGFGRARIMQAFSQVRYGIRTLDRWVEGDGPHYVNLDVTEARRRLDAWSGRMRDAADEARGRAEDDLAERLDRAADAHAADAAALGAEPERVKGCRFEVDLDPAKASVPAVLQAFRKYFTLSDVDCAVTINGEPLDQPRRRLETRKRLASTMDATSVPDSFAKSGVKVLDRADGRKDVVFGTLLSVPETLMREGERGYLNVRVLGASMYRKFVNSGGHGLVLEIDPRAAREVLTSNRDGMRTPYSDAVDEFVRQMATDARSALEDRAEEEFQVLPGGLGARMRKPRAATLETGAEVEGPAAPTPRLKVLETQARESRRRISYDARWDYEKTVRDGIEGVPFAKMREFLDSIAKAEGVDDTLLAGYADRAKAESFRETLQRQGESQALAYDEKILGYLVDQAKWRLAAAEEKAAEAYRDKMRDLHDVPILRKGMTPQADRYTEAERKQRRTALNRAARRCDPRNWDHPTGKGRAPHLLLSAWEIAVEGALDLLHESRPDLKPFPYGVGWTFSHKRWDSIPGKGRDGWINARARYAQPDPKEPQRYFLLNPLDDEDFSLAFDIRKAADLSKLWALAIHEVAHAVSADHDEGFAMAMTEMTMASTPEVLKDFAKRVKERSRAVSALFGGAQTKVQALDDEPGRRPAERLLAGLAAAEPAPAGHGAVYDLDAAHRRESEIWDEVRNEFRDGMHAPATRAA